MAAVLLRMTTEPKVELENSLPQTVSLSVVVPVKDEAGNAAALAREIAAALKDEGGFEIVFVDDGSSDGTIAELLALRPGLSLRILKHGAISDKAGR